MAQKLWTITQRTRLKGRDFYDIMFLLQNTKPDSSFLEAKFGTSNLGEVLSIITNQLGDVDFSKLAADLQPFLINESASAILTNFKVFLNQQLH